MVYSKLAALGLSVILSASGVAPAMHMSVNAESVSLVNTSEKESGVKVISEEDTETESVEAEVQESTEESTEEGQENQETEGNKGENTEGSSTEGNGEGQTTEEQTPEVNPEEQNPEEQKPETNPEEVKPEEQAPEEKPEEGTENKVESEKAEDTKPAEVKQEEQKPAETQKSTSESGTSVKDISKDKEQEMFFKPSSKFLSQKDKKLYTVNTVIDGIPKQVSKEMLLYAIKCQDEYGYPASVTVAQIIQESTGSYGDGLSYLAYGYNNLFGIKGVGTAGSAVMSTQEEVSGSLITINDGFRAYNTVEECIEDRAELLHNYYGVDGIEDANSFAAQIGGKWATSSSYTLNVIATMNRYDLYRLDNYTLIGNADSFMINPVPGASVSDWFNYEDKEKRFISLITPMELKAYAVADGEVLNVTEDSFDLKIKDDQGKVMKVTYGGLKVNQDLIKDGQKVSQGQPIGVLPANASMTFKVYTGVGFVKDPNIYLGLMSEEQCSESNLIKAAVEKKDQERVDRIVNLFKEQKEAVAKLQETSKKVQEGNTSKASKTVTTIEKFNTEK